MEGGPPIFRQDSSCPALLADLATPLARTGLSPALARLSRRFRFDVARPLAWSPFARHYWGSLAPGRLRPEDNVDFLSSGY